MQSKLGTESQSLMSTPRSHGQESIQLEKGEDDGDERGQRRTQTKIDYRTEVERRREKNKNWRIDYTLQMSQAIRAQTEEGTNIKLGLGFIVEGKMKKATCKEIPKKKCGILELGLVELF